MPFVAILVNEDLSLQKEVAERSAPVQNIWIVYRLVFSDQKTVAVLLIVVL